MEYMHRVYTEQQHCSSSQCAKKIEMIQLFVTEGLNKMGFIFQSSCT